MTLECRAVGVPKPSIMWLKDEKTIVDFGDNMVILPDDSLLIPSKLLSKILLQLPYKARVELLKSFASLLFY